MRDGSEVRGRFPTSRVLSLSLVIPTTAGTLHNKTLRMPNHRGNSGDPNYEEQ